MTKTGCLQAMNAKPHQLIMKVRLMVGYESSYDSIACSRYEMSVGRGEWQCDFKAWKTLCKPVSRDDCGLQCSFSSFILLLIAVVVCSVHRLWGRGKHGKRRNDVSGPRQSCTTSTIFYWIHLPRKCYVELLLSTTPSPCLLTGLCHYNECTARQRDERRHSQASILSPLISPTEHPHRRKASKDLPFSG